MVFTKNTQVYLHKRFVVVKIFSDVFPIIEETKLEKRVPKSLFADLKANVFLNRFKKSFRMIKKVPTTKESTCWTLALFTSMMAGHRADRIG